MKENKKQTFRGKVQINSTNWNAFNQISVAANFIEYKVNQSSLYWWVLTNFKGISKKFKNSKTNTLEFAKILKMKSSKISNVLAAYQGKWIIANIHQERYYILSNIMRNQTVNSDNKTNEYRRQIACRRTDFFRYSWSKRLNLRNALSTFHLLVRCDKKPLEPEL